jgi:hypothetical protein
MSSFRNFHFLHLACVACIFFIPALAQEASTGAIRGTVADGAGGRIGATTVVLVNAATNFRYSTTTDVTGGFAFELLPPGVARNVAANHPTLARRRGRYQ